MSPLLCESPFALKNRVRQLRRGCIVIFHGEGAERIENVFIPDENHPLRVLILGIACLILDGPGLNAHIERV